MFKACGRSAGSHGDVLSVHTETFLDKKKEKQSSNVQQRWSFSKGLHVSIAKSLHLPGLNM